MLRHFPHQQQGTMKIWSLLVGLVVWSDSCEALTGSSKSATVSIQRESQDDIYVESSNILSDKDYSEQKVSVSSSKRRALQLFEILSKEVVAPVGLALTKDGVPTDWDDFWNTPCDSQSDATLASRATLALEQMGPTYVKFGQALASRPDIVPRSLATALSTLQDQMQPFDTSLARGIVRRELSSKSLSAQELEDFVSSLSASPVAAASIGQVYSGTLPNNQKVAVKVQRPGIRETVEEDAELLRTMARLVETIPAIPRLQKDQDRLISTDLSGAVEEFMSRICEELDYRNEANNIDLFSGLYSHRRKMDGKSSNIQVVVPQPYMDLCTDNVLVMEWIDGTKLVDLQSEDSTRDSLVLIEQGIECTLSQLLDTGVLHADPHGGNLWKVSEVTKQGNTIQRLGYVDFGLLSSVPINVRDGLVCAVAELVFSRNVTAVANLFGELQLIPEEVLSDPSERAALSQSLNEALSEVLQYNNRDGPSTTTTTIPTLRFDKLLDALARLVPRFRFQLPPYFLNNARALGTLEGMAREIDPSFNVLQVLYPYALKRLLSNPNKSPVVEATLQNLIRSPVTGRVDKSRVQKLLDDSTTLTGFSRAKVVRDILSSKSGPRLARIILQEQIRQVLGRGRFTKMANYLRL
jgi:predicted unusual protein kinase regulating ubiquinone biosynthesis (AarF/ABC1/UbiB family)